MPYLNERISVVNLFQLNIHWVMSLLIHLESYLEREIEHCETDVTQDI